ncbi:MAG: iron-siderophore ABC transporter substrate-binding protein [Nostoc sp.]|uniref:iron-siderophore ABC transporter substrate-binding protein n=1 Tax=Nostoc sp. TaxID=1180 RepID=UPI002FF79F2C
MPKFCFVVLLTLLAVSACSSFGRQLTTRNINVVSSSRTSPVALHAVQHLMGQTLIPTHPQRVVVLDPWIVEIPLALGFNVVGVPDPAKTLQGIGLANKHPGIEDIGALLTPNIEKVMVVKPDLILGTKRNREAYSLWSHIAPTILLKIENSGDWKQPFMPAAKALGKTETAKRLVENYNARLTEFKQKMGFRLKKTVVSVVRLMPQTINLLTKGAFSGVIIEDAGLIRPPLQNLDAIATQKKWGSPISYNISSEILAQIDGNVLFIPLFGFKDPTEANNAVHQFMAEPLWSKLKVVKQGKFHVINGFYWQGSSYISANRVLDDLFTYILHPLEETRNKRIKPAKA